MEAFDEILTPEEKYLALKEAARIKQARINLEEYTRKIKEREKVEVITADKFLDMVLKKAEKEIEGFKLSPVEHQIYFTLSKYFTGDESVSKDGLSLKKGLLLFGGLGCGKTTAMKLFSNNPKQSFIVVPCRQVSKDFSQEGYGIEKYYGLYPIHNKFATFGQAEVSFCFDDLGTESTSKHFGNEANVMAEVFLSRYDNEVRTGFVTHTTTNLTPDEIEAYYGKRVRSRMREMFNLIEFPETITDKRK